ncbi:hypothetical protein V8J36_00755 [Frigidibacter sp. MR17.14]|uniref:hypothetical protein n=1 Tax=Frigidibacter sp. MR17.14 TaxID=3126509 RepID=UPI00301318DF
MISRLTGAAVRAVLVLILIATPSVVTQSVLPDTAEVVALVGLFAAAMVFLEYASTYPSLIEFRDARPFNRIRFLSLFVMVFLLSVVCMNRTDPAIFARLVTFLGREVAGALDFPFSPVRLVLLMLPEDTDARHLDLIRTTAGLAYFIALATLFCFIVVLRWYGWPHRKGSFNVWINLPTFDPTSGGDVVERLNRDAIGNVVLGFVLPFIIPALVRSTSIVFEPVTLASPHTLIWTMTLWASLPVTLIMRGIAMNRIASMIAERRRHNAQAAVGGSDEREMPMATPEVFRG